MKAGVDDQELTAKIRESCLKRKQPFFIFTLKSHTYVVCVKGPFIRLKGPNRGDVMADCNHTWLSFLLDRCNRRPVRRSRVKDFVEFLRLRDSKEDIDIHAERYLVQTTNANGEQETRWPAVDELTCLRWKMEEFLDGTLSSEEHFKTGVLKL